MGRIAKASVIGAMIPWFMPSTALAQSDDRAIAAAMQGCRTIEDRTARADCYDGISLGEAPAPKVQGTAAPKAATPVQAPKAFGSNQLPQADPAAEGPQEVRVTLADAVERWPGVYLMTLTDGTQWQFIDAVGTGYDPPQRGSTVELSRAALGSYLLRYEKQRSVRVRRVR